MVIRKRSLVLLLVVTGCVTPHDTAGEWSVTQDGVLSTMADWLSDEHNPFALEKTTFYSIYSRGNDDFGQNNVPAQGAIAAAPTGPYEVFTVKVGLTPKRVGVGRYRLRFQWAARASTGRHVDVEDGFVLRETESSYRTTRERAPLEKHSPPGVTETSPDAAKIGTYLYSTLDLGQIDGDGTFSGKLEMALKSKREIGQNPQLLNLFGVVGDDGGPFQHMEWSVTVRDGAIVRRRLKAYRELYTEGSPPMLYLTDNFTAERRYRPAPQVAACRAESVGGGEAASYSSEEQRLFAAVKRSGCTNCHGEGNEALVSGIGRENGGLKYCSDGRPVDASALADLVRVADNPDEEDWSDYHPGMAVAVDNWRGMTDAVRIARNLARAGSGLRFSRPRHESPRARQNAGVHPAPSSVTPGRAVSAPTAASPTHANALPAQESPLPMERSIAQGCNAWTASSPSGARNGRYYLEVTQEGGAYGVRVLRNKGASHPRYIGNVVEDDGQPRLVSSWVDIVSPRGSRPVRCARGRGGVQTCTYSLREDARLEVIFRAASSQEGQVLEGSVRGMLFSQYQCLLFRSTQGNDLTELRVQLL